MKAMNFLAVTAASAAFAVALAAAPAARAQEGPPPPPPGGQMQGEPLPGYGDFGYRPDDYAARNGYHDGYDKGMSDHNTGHSFRPTSDHYYNHPIGYHGQIPHHEYDRIYREAFLHGYERGYKR
jgi:hypothetical protein